MIEYLEFRAEHSIQTLRAKTALEVLDCQGDASGIWNYTAPWHWSRDIYGRPVIFQDWRRTQMDKLLKYTTMEKLVEY